MQGITTTIEHSGRQVTFRTLCRQFRLPYYVVWRRYRRGDRGARLVRPVEVKYGHRGQWGIEAMESVGGTAGGET